MFAWSEIKHGNGTAQPGDEVTADSLGIDADEFAQLVESRVIRKAQFPDLPPNYLGSPKEYRDSQLRAQMDEMDDNFNGVDEIEEVVEEPTTEAPEEDDLTDEGDNTTEEVT